MSENNMHQAQKRFDFFRLHFEEAKKDFAVYRWNVKYSLYEREEGVQIVKNFNAFKKNIDENDLDERSGEMLEEMKRDIKIIHSRLDRMRDDLGDIEDLSRIAAVEMCRNPKEYLSIDRAIDAFLRWREKKRDFVSYLDTTIQKWKRFEGDIAARM